ncbi:hypothetical protein GOODEAATRI_000692 [Goodea atripinnis]|uniref:Uncharacterized protein n=1 Tax=Goodea atripinnis TaxID=208336 RepID=A0ABV0NIW6_9TELE
MVMEPKKGDGDEASSSSNAEPSSVNPSKSVASPLFDLSFLNKSIVVPLLDTHATEEDQEETAPVLIRTSTTHLCLKPVGQVPLPSAKPEQDSSPLFVPSKSHQSPDTNKTEVEPTKVSDGNVRRLHELKQSDITVEEINVRVQDTPGAVREAAHKPTSVKRGRGRPPKKKVVEGRSSAVKRPRSPDSNDYTPIKFSMASLKSPNSPTSQGEGFTSRPFTRASLGKDFPSAKKRSWIDVEKELEPDLEFV